jgi:hypothetical protein
VTAMEVRPQDAPVIAEIQRLKARVAELEDLLAAARQNVIREQDEHQAYRFEHPAVQVVLPPAGWVDRITSFVAFRLTGRQLAANTAISAGLIAWARHTNRTGGTR